ncbi:alpha/beta-hydrolase [Auriscalpium vulgare]|uniref:Alpha/beta-hydrolase n=1 Tax=Auriscalpium vulgare TaxID=40419 RepID=A0ACB8SAY0_9AGAM|nr:alpha/beta-hydrolase [Auriscalpium vulgare]
MPARTPFQCLTLLLLVLPFCLLAAYLVAQFPHAPEITHIHPSLASLSHTSKSWDVYPEDFYDGGAYVTLPYGRVRYWMLGPEKGKKVVLVHGLSIPAMVWRDVAPALAGRGYRVLLYDLYGRGYSDAPETTYDAPLYTMQLALLMQHVKWAKAKVVGLSMGGGVTAAFSLYFPSLVDGKIALIASTGLVEAGDISRTMRFMSSPIVQAVASSPPVRFYLQRLANTTYPDPLNEIVRLQSAHLPGYNPAIASSLRDGPVRGLTPVFEQLGASDLQVLLIWGTADTVVPYKYAGLMQTLLPRSELVTVDGGKHDLTTSHPATVIAALVRFFESK